MATFPTAPAEQPPPNLPDLPDGPPQLANYLRTFALWCRNGFHAKLDANAALPGILLQAYDAAAGTTPNVYFLRVDQNGIIVTQRMPLAGGPPGDALEFAPQTGYAESSVANPAGTASAAYVMMGCNLVLTGSVANAVWATADGQITNTANNGETDCVIVYGTGTPPLNGAALTGTIAGQPARYVATAANDYVPFSLTALITDVAAAVAGGTFWVDLALKATGGTAQVMDLNFSAHGLA